MSLRGRPFICLILLLSAAMAGCLASDDPPVGDDDPNGTDDGATANGGGTASGGNGGDDGDVETPGGATITVTAVITVDAPDTLTVGDNVTFNATGSDGSGTNLTFAWDLGDGTEASGMEVVHAYTEAGNFTVVLTATSESGATNTTDVTVTVEAKDLDFSETLSGSLTLPNPLLVLIGGGTVGGDGDLSDYEELGGVEGTTYTLHEVNDVPNEAAEVKFTLTTSTHLVHFVIFDADGERLAFRTLSGQTGGTVTLKEEAAGLGDYIVLVYSALLPAADYDIVVTVA